MVLIPKIPKTAFADLVEPKPKAVRLGTAASRSMTENYGSVNVAEVERYMRNRFSPTWRADSRAYALIKQAGISGGTTTPELAARLAFVAVIAEDGEALDRYDELEDAVGDSAPLSTDEIRLSLGGDYDPAAAEKPFAAADRLLAEVKGETAMLKSPWRREDTVVRIDPNPAAKALRKAAAGLSPLTPFHEARLAKETATRAADELEMFRHLRRPLSPLAAEYLDKALAVGHDIDSLGDFALAIEGKDDGWLRTNLTAYDPLRGRGLTQQWGDSCVASIAQTIRAEIDPIYALSLHQANQDIYSRWNGAAYKDGGDELGPNASLVREQRRLSLAAAQTADLGKSGDKLVPIWQMEYVDSTFPGVRDINRALNTAFAGLPLTLKSTRQPTVVKRLDETLQKGLPVLMAAIDEHDQDDSHAFTFLAKVNADGKSGYMMHDPSSGIVRPIDVAALKKRGIQTSNGRYDPAYFYHLVESP